MANRQAQIPGGAYYNDVEEASLYQRQVPGFQYVNDTQQTAGGGGDPEGSLIAGKLIRGGLLLHGVLGR